MLNKFVIAAGIMVFIAGFNSMNNEPDAMNMFLFSISFSLFFGLAGVRDWLHGDRIAGYMEFTAALLFMVYMIYSLA